jgi:hypothetical protein
MGEDTNAIEREIRERRAQLGSTVDALEAKAARAADWRQRFRENPKTGLAIAFGVGVIASGMLSGDSEYDGRHRNSGRSKSAMSGLKTALLGVLAVEARRYVQGQLRSRGSDPTAA